MEQIIQQIVCSAVKNILKYYEMNGLGTLSDMSEDLKVISDDLVKALILLFISQADKALCGAKKERRDDKLSIHERSEERTLFTALGDITYERTYFDQVGGGHIYLLDQILDVDPYERVDAGVSAKLINTAANLSYGRSTDIVTGGRISRQTVRNKIMESGEVATLPTRSENTPASLHIFADEDHVSLQDGNGAIVPLVTICEGKTQKCKGRNELIDPLHIHGYGIKPDQLWEYVYAVCAEKYDMDKVKKIYVYGDGGSWITNGFTIFPEAVYVFDEFHYKKRMKSLLAGSICAAFSLRAYSAVKHDKRGAFGDVVLEMHDALEEKLEGTELTKRQKRLREDATYILNQWEAIQNMKIEDSIGSCTEALVSHVFSERLSRNPMGWSKEGLSKMAAIRVFCINGGVINPSDIGLDKSKKNADKDNEPKRVVISNIAKYDALVKQQQDEVLASARDWRMFSNESDWSYGHSGKRNGTRVALRLLGQTREVS
jgi:hypothetical protein